MKGIYLSTKISSLARQAGYKSEDNCYTLDNLHRWLMENKDIFVEISIMPRKKFSYQCYQISKCTLIGNRDPGDYSNYDQALQGGLEEASQLIHKIPARQV